MRFPISSSGVAWRKVDENHRRRLYLYGVIGGTRPRSGRIWGAWHRRRDDRIVWRTFGLAEDAAASGAVSSPSDSDESEEDEPEPEDKLSDVGAVADDK